MELSDESGDGFILARLNRYGVQVKYREGAPPGPPTDTPSFLDHLDRYALEVLVGAPGTVRLAREGDGFVLDRRKRRRARYTSIRKALKKLIFELSAKQG